MADAILYLWRELCAGHPILRNKKDRIIPETMRTTGSIGNPTLQRPLDILIITRRFGNRDHTTKTSSPLLWRNITEALIQNAKALLIGGINASEAGRVYTGCSSEGIYFQTRVIGKREFPRSTCICQSLQF